MVLSLRHGFPLSVIHPSALDVLPLKKTFLLPSSPISPAAQLPEKNVAMISENKPFPLRKQCCVLHNVTDYDLQHSFMDIPKPLHYFESGVDFLFCVYHNVSHPRDAAHAPWLH